MPKVIETTVYDFSELSDAAKEKARDWYKEACADDDCSVTWDCLKEDAASIGLKIKSLDDHRSNEGEFIVSAIECSEAIFSNHGKDCETYKTAQRFVESVDALPELVADAEGDYEHEAEREHCMAIDALEAEFLHALLEDYRILYNKDVEYQYSNKVVDENIIANGYTFTESGKREG